MKYLAKVLYKVLVFGAVTMLYCLSVVAWLSHMLWEFKLLPFIGGDCWYSDWTYSEVVEEGFYIDDDNNPTSHNHYGMGNYSIVHEWKTGYHYIFGGAYKVHDNRPNKPTVRATPTKNNGWYV